MKIVISKKLQKVILFFFTLLFIFITQQAIANESKPINQGDLVYDLQLVDPIVLSEDVEALKASLAEQKLKLIEISDNKKISTSDVVISLILPGGMLYAGYRMYEQEKAKKSLLIITDDINDLSIDSIALSAEISESLYERIASAGFTRNINF